MKMLISRLVFVPFLIAMSLLVTSCGDGSSKRNIKIPGVDGPRVVLNQDDVLIAMVLENVQLQGGLRYNIPKYPNSYIEVSPDLQSNGTLVAFSISLDDVFGANIHEMDPLSLPGGRALPGVATGTLPAVAFNVEKLHDISVYLGPNVFGIFVPIKMKVGGAIVSARFYSSDTRVGNISLVGEDENGENSGVLLMLDMKKSTKRKLNYLAKRY